MPKEAELPSELFKIAKLNGDFCKNYGTLLGAFLYLRSISAACGRVGSCAGLVSLCCSMALGWFVRHHGLAGGK